LTFAASANSEATLLKVPLFFAAGRFPRAPRPRERAPVPRSTEKKEGIRWGADRRAEHPMAPPVRQSGMGELVID
jgi:hypothetical protein